MTIEVMVEHLGELQFEVQARGHKVICDQPIANAGYDEGMTPPELMLASLGTCAGYYAVQYLKAGNLPTEGLRIRTSAKKRQDPARLDDIVIEVQYPNELDQRHRDGLDRAVRACLIHNTLLHSPRIQVQVVTPVSA